MRWQAAAALAAATFAAGDFAAAAIAASGANPILDPEAAMAAILAALRAGRVFSADVSANLKLTTFANASRRMR